MPNYRTHDQNTGFVREHHPLGVALGVVLALLLMILALTLPVQAQSHSTNASSQGRAPDSVYAILSSFEAVDVPQATVKEKKNFLLHLAQVYNDSSAALYVRLRALRLMARTGKPQGATLLRSVASQPAQKDLVLIEALSSLVELEGRGASAFLLKFRSHLNTQVRNHANRLLRRIGNRLDNG